MADRLLHEGTFQSCKSSIYGLPKQLLIMKMYASKIALVATWSLQHIWLVQEKVTDKANAEMVSIFFFNSGWDSHFCRYQARLTQRPLRTQAVTTAVLLNQLVHHCKHY